MLAKDAGEAFPSTTLLPGGTVNVSLTTWLLTVVALLSLPHGWVWPTPWEAALLVLSGILGGLGQILLTEAYRHADTSTIASTPFGAIFRTSATTSCAL